MTKLRALIILGTVVGLMPVFSRPVMAYLDPGSGSLFIQIAIATAVSALFAAKSFWSQITTFISKQKRSNKVDDKD